MCMIVGVRESGTHSSRVRDGIDEEKLAIGAAQHAIVLEPQPVKECSDALAGTGGKSMYAPNEWMTCSGHDAYQPVNEKEKNERRRKDDGS
jgi:hypothetical protein